jgi:hypothetical protein
MPTYPADSPNLTVEAFLRDSTMSARALTDLTYRRFAADRLLNRGTPDQVASGSAVFQRSESIFPDRDVRELALRTQYPRTGWSEQLMTAVVHKYGLESPIAYESIRRNARDQLAIALRKIANSMVRFIDTLAMNLILNDAATLGGAASADWSVAGTDIRRDLLIARSAIADQNEGYEPNTLVINPAQELDLQTDDVLGELYLAFMMGAGTGTLIAPGVRPVNFLGFDEIIVTPSIPAGRVLILDRNVAGTIADESPAAGEGYATFGPGVAFPGAEAVAPIYTKVWDETEIDSRVIRGVRWPAMWISEPKAVYDMTGA